MKLRTRHPSRAIAGLFVVVFYTIGEPAKCSAPSQSGDHVTGLVSSTLDRFLAPFELLTGKRFRDIKWRLTVVGIDSDSPGDNPEFRLEIVKRFGGGIVIEATQILERDIMTQVESIVAAKPGITSEQVWASIEKCEMRLESGIGEELFGLVTAFEKIPVQFSIDEILPLHGGAYEVLVEYGTIWYRAGLTNRNRSDNALVEFIEKLREASLRRCLLARKEANGATPLN